ncbi:MAG: ribonuclease III family protein, partial [Promethearchaeota archaeon]
YDILTKDLNSILIQKAIGTDKGLAKIGDGVVNLAYSVAKSLYLTKTSKNKGIVRTGWKVSKEVLSPALKNAGLKDFAKNRADAHDMADTAEALVAYIWLGGAMSVKDITDILFDNLDGDFYKRTEEIKSATKAFTILLEHLKKYLPETSP